MVLAIYWFSTLSFSAMHFDASICFAAKLFLWCVMRHWSKCVKFLWSGDEVTVSQCLFWFAAAVWLSMLTAQTSRIDIITLFYKKNNPTVWDGRMSHLVCTWWLQWSWPSSCWGAQPAPRLWATQSVTEQQNREVSKCSKVSSFSCVPMWCSTRNQLQLWLRVFESQMTSRAFNHSESLWCWRLKTTRFE